MPVLGRPPDATVSRIVSKKGAAVGATGARADVRWEVGGFARTNPGESVSATVHTGPKGAPQEWNLVFYPRGFVDPASVSVFITNVGCREQKAPPTDADITATVMVCAIPAAEDGSTKAGSSKKESKAGKKGANACRKFSRTFSSNAHTFGFEQFADWSVLFGKGSPFLHSGGAGGGDSLMLQVVINVCVAPPLSPVEVDHTVRDSGWQRVSWPLRDFKGLIENTPAACRLSSPIFYLNGDWYLDLYPAGYRLDEDDREARVSVYLHSTKSQADRGDKLKKRLKFGIKRINPLPRDFYAALGEAVEDDVLWASRGELSAIFCASQLSAGCPSVAPCSVFERGRDVCKKVVDLHNVKGKDLIRELVAGKFDKGGSVTVVVDLLVTDQVNGQVQQGLFLHALPSGEGHEVAGRCHVSKRPFSLPSVLGGAPGKAGRCYMCGYFVSAHLLGVAPHTRLPQFGYETGREIIMDVCLREAPGMGLERWLGELRAACRDLVPNAVNNELLAKAQAPLDFLSLHLSRLQQSLAGVSSGKPVLVEYAGALGSESNHNNDDRARAACQQLSVREQRKIEAEERRQEAFERKLGIVRQQMEDALFAKPVCPQCDEVCKALAQKPRLAVSCQGYARGWKQAWSDCKRALRDKVHGVGARTAGASAGAGRSVSCLARGGIWGESPELVKQCPGRVNSSQPSRADAGDDFPLDGFCDVRFDRKQRSLLGTDVPKQLHCSASGKVFCSKCAAFSLRLPHLSADPDAPSPMVVCKEVFLAASSGGAAEVGGRVQYVTDRRPVATASALPSPMVVRSEEVSEADEPDEDEASLVTALLRRVPLVRPLAERLGAVVPGLGQP